MTHKDSASKQNVVFYRTPFRAPGIITTLRMPGAEFYMGVLICPKPNPRTKLSPSLAETKNSQN